MYLHMDKTCHHVRTNLLDAKWDELFFKGAFLFLYTPICFYEIHHQCAMNILYIFRENTNLGKKENNLRMLPQKTFRPNMEPKFSND